MAIPTVITDLSATLASNAPAGGDAAFPNIDDYLRAAYGFIRQGDTKASDVASASSTDLGAVVGRIVDVTGVTTITSFGTVAAGIWRIVRFTGALTLTHNATSLILPGGANITTAAGDCLIAVSLGSGNWVVTHFQRATLGSFCASASATQTSITTNIITFNTEVFDNGGVFNTSTYQFTAPVTGFYQVNVVVTVQNSSAASDNGTLFLRKNGSPNYDIGEQTFDLNAAAYVPVTLSGVISLAQGDYLEAATNLTLSANLLLVARRRFSAALLR